MANLTSKLTIQLIDDVSKPARSVAEALAQADKRVREIGKDLNAAGASDKLATTLAKMKTQKSDIEQVAKAWKDYAKSAQLGADATKWTNEEVAGVKAWERQTVQAVRAVIRERQAEARAEAQMARASAAAHQKVEAQRHKWLGGEKSLAGTLGAAAIGGEMVEAGKKAVELAADLEKERFRIRAMGGANEAAAADKLAGAVSTQYPSVTRANALDTYRELRANAINPDGTLNPERAGSNLMTAGRAQQAASTLGVELTPRDLQNLLKSNETSGRAGDPEAFGKVLDSYLKAKQMYGTAVSSDAMLTFTQNAKSANFGLSDSVYYGSLWARLAEGNSARLGNEFSQTMSTLVGGHMTKQGAQWLVGKGLISQDQIVDGKGGKFYIKGNIKDHNMLSADPTTWADTVMLPALKNSGVLDEAKVAERVKLMGDEEKKRTGVAPNEEVLRERAQAGLISDDLYKSGFRSTVVDQIAHAIVNSPLINRDTAAMGKLPGAEIAGEMGQNASAAFKEFTAALANFAAVLASPAIAAAGPVLDSMAKGLASITAGLADFQKAHPAAATALGGLAVGGAVAGGGALTYGALSGLMTGFGLSGSATALSGSAAELSAAAVALRGGAAAEALGGAAGAGGGLWGKLKALGVGALPFIKGAWPLAAAAGVKAGADYLDPNGNLGGLTTPIDKWVKTHIGFDPSNIPTPTFTAPKSAVVKPYSFADEIAGGLGGGETQVKVDSAALDDVKPKAEAAKMSLSLLGDPITLTGDTAFLDGVAPKAEAAKSSLAPLSQPIAITGDTGFLDAVIAKANAAQNALAKLNASAGAVRMPSLGATLRGNFTSSSQSGE